ncbi:MAG: glycosyltransferase family 4 protein [Bacteroidaceae bacterium]|nr:glycosyltransferase family 4 protein [Bacteroidaceae bacterium]
MKKVILLTPLTGNGGIASWSRKFIQTFKDENYTLIPIDRTAKGRTFQETTFFKRMKAGLVEMKRNIEQIKKEIAKQQIDILHTTTSGSLGTYRDYQVAKICRKHGIKTIMHCHYGCIPEDIKKPLYGKFLQKTMSLYDQIWVLDTRTEKVLKEYPALKDKVFVTPNSIHVDEGIKIQPSNYKHIAFVGNLIPNKGLYELVEAVVKNSSQEVRLSIVGKGDENVITKIKAIAGNKLNKRVHLLGLLSNEEAVAFMKMVDIVALPTYYPWEAFPISILEAMSLGKLVISTPRAAIKDMLTALDGTDCGILVREKSVEDIVQAIEWCNIHKDEADELCRKAYEKVYTAYRMEVVYSLYRQLYRKL